MSLTAFVEMPEVRAKIRPLHPRVSLEVPVPLKVKPRSSRYTLIGTAFDYLLRFELQRRAPHAVAGRWVAESAPDLIYSEYNNGTTLSLVLSPDVSSSPPEEVRKRAEKIIAEAKTAVANYLESGAPVLLPNLAAHAIRLAKLDSVRRALVLEPQFEEVNAEDVQDLLDMLAIVPFDSLLHEETLILNPTFGDSSILVGGADADLISGDMLVEFKTTKQGKVKLGHLDQLFGYYLLARNQKRIDSTFPAINKVGVYFCRHGYLWILNTIAWTENPQFPEIERWFLKYAEKVYAQTEARMHSQIEALIMKAHKGNSVLKDRRE
jgi:hypothetical protein